MGSAWVMLYHQVLSGTDSIWAVPAREIAGAVDRAREAGLRVAALGDAFDGPAAMTLTFDDACLSVYESAFPLLGALGVAATVFVPVDHVGTSGTMTWGHLAELTRHGWAVESHGCSHRPLDGMTRAAVEEELSRSRLVLEDRLGREVRCFAYPYGAAPASDDPAATAALLAAAGYTLAVLAAGGRARTPLKDPYRVPREPVAPGQRLSFGGIRQQA